MHPGHRRAAVFAHYRNVPRRAGRDAGNIVVVMMRDGWFWLIPFADGRTSVGVVADGRNIQEQRLPVDALLGLAIDRCPAVSRLMAKAERVSRVYATSDWTYRSRRIVGDGYLLVGDAAAFIDPVFSTGVLLAMSSAEMAADLLDEALRKDVLPERHLRYYERAVAEHVRGYWRMVETFYGSAFPRLCFYPTTRLEIPPAILTLLAGDMQPAWPVRWRHDRPLAIRGRAPVHRGPAARARGGRRHSTAQSQPGLGRGAPRLLPLPRRPLVRALLLGPGGVGALL
jgi:2-polyprenyl-6-methoxyphenol hydroxylase-like FAD-dependent oxidoreductase